jgi:hypothetical protein
MLIIKNLMKLVGFVYSPHDKVYRTDEIWPSECFNINQKLENNLTFNAFNITKQFKEHYNFECLLIEILENNLTINVSISTKIR